MKKTTLFLFVFMAFPLALTLFSRCTPDYAYLYIHPNALVFDTLRPQLPLADHDTCPFQSHYLTVLMPVEQYHAAVPSGFSSAYASYKDDSFSPVEEISEIRIITLYPYRQFPAGSDISDSCDFFRDQNLSDSAFFSSPRLQQEKQDIIWEMNDQQNQLGEYAHEIRRFSFRLKQPPVSGSLQRLAVVFVTKERSRYSDTTDFFYLKP